MPFEHYAFSLGTGPVDGLRVVAERALCAVGDVLRSRCSPARSPPPASSAAVLGLRLPPAFLVASVAALAAHGGLLLTALLAAGFTRFLLGLWPALVVALAFGSWAMINRRSEGS